MSPFGDEECLMSRRSGIMLCYPFEEKRLLKWDCRSVLVQPKLDGERCRAVITNGNVQLLTSENNEIYSAPHIVEALSANFKEETIELDGELYIHNADFSEIHSIRGRTVNLHEDYERKTA
jgi:ATP-dependent DNA ligase